MERDLIPEIKRTERTKDIWRGKTHRWRGSSDRAAKRAEKRQWISKKNEETGITAELDPKLVFKITFVRHCILRVIALQVWETPTIRTTDRCSPKPNGVPQPPWHYFSNARNSHSTNHSSNVGNFLSVTHYSASVGYPHSANNPPSVRNSPLYGLSTLNTRNAYFRSYQYSNAMPEKIDLEQTKQAQKQAKLKRGTHTHTWNPAHTHRHTRKPEGQGQTHSTV